jgi:hypothetical protein
MDVRLTAVSVADAALVAGGVAQPEDAMTVYIGRGGKGRVAPFTVQRSYTGAGGWYVEVMTLLAPNGEVAWRGPERSIDLRGANKIDTFTDDVRDASLGSSEDHELVFLLSDGRRTGWMSPIRMDEVARVPLSVADADPPVVDNTTTAILAEALKKGTVVWISVPGPGGTGAHGIPAWYGLHDNRVYVLTGGSEQRIPGLAETDRAVLTARSKDLQSRVVDAEASARVIPSNDPLFDTLVPILLPRRLNLRDGEAAGDRWRKESTLVELTPSAVPTS